MKKCLFLLLPAVSLCACAQVNKTVVKASAYYTIRVPGTMMVDETGKQMPPPRLKAYTVYFELKGAAPQWTKAWTGGQSFTPVAGATSTDPVVVGKKYPDGKQIVLKASKHTVLLQVELVPDETEKQPPQKLGTNDLLFEGVLKGKPFYYKISGLTQLASPDYP